MSNESSPEITVEYEVVSKEGEFCASATSLPDAMHYVTVYSQDHPVELWKVTREKVLLLEEAGNG